MEKDFDPNLPSIDELRNRASKRIPRFAMEYLEGGVLSDINLKRNFDEIRNVQLKPCCLGDFSGASMEMNLFGETYSSPFGVSPIRLQGLMWPGATEILAKAAFESNIPFVLSTDATASIEKVAEITEGR